MDCDGFVSSVVEQQHHGEMLSAANAELWCEQQGHDVEIVRRVEATVERPSLAELHPEAWRIFSRTVSAHWREWDLSRADSVHDVGGSHTAHQRLGEHKRERLLVITQVVRRQIVCRTLTI